MALSPTLVDREQAKFEETPGGETAVRVTADASGPVTVSSVPFSTGTNSRPSVTNVDSTILASNPLRKYAMIVNNGGTTVFLKLGSAAVVNQGIPLGPNDIFEITQDKLFSGDIHAIKSTAAALAIDVLECT